MDKLQLVLNNLADKLANMTEDEIKGVAKLIPAGESIGVTAPEAVNFINTIESAFQFSAAHEDFNGGQNIDEDLVEKSKKLVLSAMNPVETLEKLAKHQNRLADELKASNENMDVTVVSRDFSPVAKDSSQMYGSLLAAAEDINSIDIKKSIFFTVAFNSIEKTQDPVIETFFPTVQLDIDTQEIYVEVDVIHYITPFKRLPNGQPVNYRKEPYIKHIEDFNRYVIDGNRLYPILRVDGEYVNTNYLLNEDGAKREVELMDGVKVTTAPIKAGVETNILNLSQTDTLLAKGFLNELDTILPVLNIETVYFWITGKDKDGNDVTELYRKEIGGLPISFLYTLDGNDKDMQLNESRSFIFKAPFITASGNPTQIKALQDLTDGYYMILEVNFKGDANVDTANILVNQFSSKFKGIYDNNGNELNPDDYADAVAAVSGAKLAGYDIEAYGNTEMGRYEGKRLNISSYAFVYNVPSRVKLSEKTPAFQLGSDKKPKGLYSLVGYTVDAMNAHGFTTLFKYIAALPHMADDYKTFGVANFLINKYHRDDLVIDVKKLVNSLKSSERLVDIQAAFELYVKTIAWDMYNNSNYKFAFDHYYPGQKPVVIIGTSAKINQYFKSFEDERFRYVVVGSKYGIMNDKLIISFGIDKQLDANINKAANPLSFGVTWVKNEIVLNYTVREGKAQYDQNDVILSFKHQPFLPIVAVANVINLDEAVRQLPIYVESLS